MRNGKRFGGSGLRGRYPVWPARGMPRHPTSLSDSITDVVSQLPIKKMGIGAALGYGVAHLVGMTSKQKLFAAAVGALMGKVMAPRPWSGIPDLLPEFAPSEAYYPGAAGQSIVTGPVTTVVAQQPAPSIVSAPVGYMVGTAPATETLLTSTQQAVTKAPVASPRLIASEPFSPVTRLVEKVASLIPVKKIEPEPSAKLETGTVIPTAPTGTKLPTLGPSSTILPAPTGTTLPSIYSSKLPFPTGTTLPPAETTKTPAVTLSPLPSSIAAQVPTVTKTPDITITKEPVIAKTPMMVVDPLTKAIAGPVAVTYPVEKTTVSTKPLEPITSIAEKTIAPIVSSFTKTESAPPPIGVTTPVFSPKPTVSTTTVKSTLVPLSTTIVPATTLDRSPVGIAPISSTVLVKK